MKYITKTSKISAQEVPKEPREKIQLHQTTKVKPTPQKKRKKKSLQKDSQTREWVKPPDMIIESKIGVIRFQQLEGLQLNFIDEML